MVETSIAALTMTNHTDSTTTDLSHRHEVGHHAGFSMTGPGQQEGVGSEKGVLEEALETHEVVEINKFNERKEWIEEKIRLLESMPPIEVFVGVDVLLSHSESIPPDLPTRAQLDRWLEEHEIIEKETEIFDVEDMSKLKKLTKAATQRNLSPEDTDLIELTLTTLLALDRLLHLLRDRSESLELLSLRLAWEEQRVTAWKERHSLISDLEAFLTTRARWSLDTYELPLSSTPSSSPALKFASPPPLASPRPSPSPVNRRDSVASLASVSSDTSTSTTGPSTTFSRSTRYKLAELLSHDAALFSSRITALHHGKVIPAGKTLDKLIDTSRKPVPDEILDEQDRLEDKAIKELETLGKYAMAVVTQWKRADEHYNDTRKDQAAAQALITELNNANLQHPTARHATAFTSRADALLKRLAVKGDPALPRSSFPRPVHPLFMNQGVSNETIVKTLSAELSEAVTLARQAESAAQAYHAVYEAVNRAEILKDHMESLSKQLDELDNKLVNGMHPEGGHGDASPPDLSKETSLDPTRHATFLALLPSVAQLLNQVDNAAEHALHDSRGSYIRLQELSGVDAKLKNDLVAAMQELEIKRRAAKKAKENVLINSQRLKEVRGLWGNLNDIMDSVEDFKQQAVHGMEGQRWKRSSRGDAPLPPDSLELPQTPLLFTLTPHALSQRLEELWQRLSTDVVDPIPRILTSPGCPISLHLQSSCDGLMRHIDDVRDLIRLWESILKQAEAMGSAQHAMGELEDNIDKLQIDIDDARQEVLHGNQTLDSYATLESGLNSRAGALRERIQTFTDSLTTRVILVSRTSNLRILHAQSNKPPTLPSSFDHHLNRLKMSSDMTLPFNLSAIDNDVRAEANALALGLAGGMHLVTQRLNHLRLACLAKTIDDTVEELARWLSNSEQTLSNFNLSFESHSSIDAVVSAMEQFDQFAQDHHRRVSQITSPLQQSLQSLQAEPGSRDTLIHDTIIISRVKAVHDVLRRVDIVRDTITQLRERIREATNAEDERLDKLRMEAEEKGKLEGQKLEAEKAKQQDVRLQADENTRLEQNHLDAEKKANVEMSSRRGHEQQYIGAMLPAIANKMSIVKHTLGQTRVLHKPPHQDIVSQSGTVDEDVFGRRIIPSLAPTKTSPPQIAELRTSVWSLQHKLRSLSMDSVVQSSTSCDGGASAPLPTLQQTFDTRSKFFAVMEETAALPVTITEDMTVDTELKSLRSDLDAARNMIQCLVQLGQFGDKVASCDNALSDLLEHADTYPAAPSNLASPHVSDARLPCEEQLANRLKFTKGVIDEMSQTGEAVVYDLRVVAERSRLHQTWSELTDMCTDRINGARSRPVSSVSSTRSISNASAQKNKKPFLSANGCHSRPSEKHIRRAVSGAHDTSRSSTHISNRSVSGPSGISSLYNTTFASRQRTTSLASIQSTISSPFKRPMTPSNQPRTTSKRPGSPSFSETSGHSIASTPSRSTWSRAPRQSFGIRETFQAHDPIAKRKTYVANPKSKLDIAVGNVVNNFRVPVTVQAAGDGWKDQSGKYFIGDEEPKLCFCRILRSQTVMVRVGGGWCELSKFLRGHFADLLAELPPSPPQPEERWISAATVREAMETPASGARSSTTSTPESRGIGVLPSLQLSTPNGTSPQTLRTPSSLGGGSPVLTPFQFMRRADAGVRPVTPSPVKGLKPVGGVTSTPSRTNIWRP